MMVKAVFLLRNDSQRNNNSVSKKNKDIDILN